jgi:hypothetical protein
MLAAAGVSPEKTMNADDPTKNPVLDTLRKAGAVHSRQRAIMFLMMAGLVVLASIPLLLLADVLFHFPDMGRLMGGLAIILAAIACVAIGIWIACFVRPPLLRIARLLESRNPALGSKLVNILQLHDTANSEKGDPLTRSLSRHAVAAAEKELDLNALPSIARESRVKARFRTLASVAVLLAVLSVFGGRHVHDQWLRFLDPFGDHPPFSLTQLEIIAPTASQEILYGDGFTVEVQAKGHTPKDLFLTATSEEGKQTIPMSARGDGTYLARLEDITSPLVLTAHTGDNSSRSHRRTLKLQMTPQLRGTRVTITPPEYTALPQRELAYGFSPLQALEGTTISFAVNSNRPLGAGTLGFDSGNAAPESFPIAPAESDPNTAIGTLTAKDSGRMTFSVIDVDGTAAKDSPAASLTVTRDQPPAITITAPDEDALVVEGLSLPIIIDAADDYGLRSVRLHIAVNGEFTEIEPIAFDESNVRRHRIEHVLDLKALNAKPGDKITVFAEAIDTRPDPQLSRTTSRRLDIITEEDYNQRLREQADVASIAGKYEDLLNRFERQIEEQRSIEKKLNELRERAEKNPDDKELLGEFSEAFAEQLELNQRLGEMADEMADFGREDPVYDFEKGLQEKLKERAEAIRESAKQNQSESEDALEKGDPPPAAPSKEMMESLEQAAREQRERLEGEGEKAGEEVMEPLEDLAHLHELMKDFNLFKEMADEQRELAEQSKAYKDKQELNAEDRLALRELGARQRELAPKLDALSKKLEADAEAAEEKFPEAAASAQQLADAIESANMPDLARQAAQSMLGAKSDDSHSQAQNLSEEMDRLFEENAQPGQQGVAGGLDQALRLERGMNPGDSLRQMMLSRRFRGLPGEGQSGTGSSGMMSSAPMQGAGKLMGGETLMDGPLAQSLGGKGPGGTEGLSGAPTARLDPADETKLDAESARRTGTPEGSTLLMEYEKLADAYFQRLTTKP